MSERDVDLSVVVPVYNSRDCLPALLKQLSVELDGMGKSHEVILVEDASPDDSWDVIRGLSSVYPRLRAFRMMRNVGQAKATLCGLAHARGQIVFTMDDDLQHRPDQMPKLLQALESDPTLDCVFGVFHEKKHSAYRNVGSRVLRWMNYSAFDLPANTRTSGFRAMRRSLVSAITQYDTRTPTLLALILESTKRFGSVEVVHADRFAGRSNYTLGKQFLLAFDNLCNVSMLPLRFVTLMGLVFCALSLLMVAYVLFRKLTGDIGVAGWTTVVILVSFFSGMIMLSLGIIGEYLSRIMREVRGNPPYLIRDEIGDEHPAA
jgi:glycosyltransferase involved in cell wall biosynthesis